MKSYGTLEEFMQEREWYMSSLAENREYSLSIQALLQQRLDGCIRSGNYDSLEALLPYFESLDSYPKLHHTSEMRRIYILIRILLLELKYNENLFSSSVSGYQDCVKQYILAVFSMRRLELSLSGESVEEASAYLQSIPFSVHAARLISENEYFENFRNLYRNLYACMRGQWSIVSRIFWLTCLLDITETAEVLLELSSLYIEIGEYRKAVSCLQRIPSPSRETVALISSLKELISNE